MSISSKRSSSHMQLKSPLRPSFSILGHTVDRLLLRILLILVTSLVFLLDLVTPPGVAVGYLYVLAILVTAWLPGTRVSMATATICTALTLIAVVVPPNPDKPFDYWSVFLNRSFSIATLWIVTLAILERKRSEETLSSIMQGSPIGMILVDSERKIRMLNQQAEVLFDYGPGDWFGVGIERLLPASKQGRRPEDITKNMAGSNPWTAGDALEIVGRRRDGTEFPVEVALSPIATAAGKMTLISILDVGDRQAALALLQCRARQQSAVADMGQLALETSNLQQLFDETAMRTARTLDVEYSKILELIEDGATLKLRAGVGWREGLVGSATVGTERESHAGYVLMCREPVIIEDLERESRFLGSTLLRDHHVVSGINCAIAGSGGHTFGVIGCYSTAKRQFTEDDVHFLEAMANVLAQTIQRFQAEEERKVNLALVAYSRQQENLRAKQQASIAEVGKAALKTGDLGTVMNLVVREVSKILGVKCSKIVEFHPDRERFLVKAGIGWKEGIVGREIFGSGSTDSQAGYTVATGQPLIVEDVQSDERFRPASFIYDHGVVSALNCPIVPADGIPFGVLEADSVEPREFSKDDLIYMEGIAQVVAFAIDRFRSEEAMRQYVLMLDASSEPIFLWDFDAGIFEWNKGCERLYGFTKAEALWRRSHELLRTRHPVSAENFLTSLDNESEWKGELEQTTKDGRTVVVESRQQVIELGGRKVVLETNRDITERRVAYEALERSETRLAKEAASLRRLHEVTNQLVVSGDLRIGFEKLLDASLELLQADFGTVQLYDSKTATLEILAQRGFSQEFLDHFRRVKVGDGSACALALASGNRVIIEDVRVDPRYEPHRATAASAGYRAVQSTPLLDYRNQPLGMLSTHWRDPYRPNDRVLQMLDLYARQAGDMITRIDAEKSLKLLNASLEERVRIRTQELLEKQEQLRAMTRELMLTEQRERRRLSTELHDYLAQLLVVSRLKLNQAKRFIGFERGPALFDEMDQILDQSLTYTRSLVAELSPQVLYQFGLPKALEWLGDQMRQHGLTVNVTTEVDIVPLSEEQAVLLFQSARELLLNVVKHAGTNRATICLSIEPDQELHIEVADEGRGFDLASTASAGAASSTKFGHFSIRERMEGLKGRLNIDSSIGRGTRVTLVLPLGSGKSRDVETSQEPHESHERKKPTSDSGWQTESRVRVLIVDDHAMVREGLRTSLENHPCVKVMGEASNGAEALTLAKRLRPDVIVMDVNMDGMDGIEATQRLSDEFPSIHVIGLSVNADEFTREAMLKAGAKVFLSKHAATDKLSATIVELVRSGEG